MAWGERSKSFQIGIGTSPTVGVSLTIGTSHNIGNYPTLRSELFTLLASGTMEVLLTHVPLVDPGRGRHLLHTTGFPSAVNCLERTLIEKLRT